MEIFEKIILFTRNWFNNLSDDQKKRFALICTIVFAMILTLSVLISINNQGKKKSPAGQERAAVITPIPAEEIFMPDEPDFVPGVILQREIRQNWTEEDAAVFWQDPLRSGEEAWREKIEIVIDDLLERVP